MSWHGAVSIAWHTLHVHVADTVPARLTPWQIGIFWLLQVVMLFAADFWGGADMFGRLALSTGERGKFFLFYSYTGISGKHIHSRHSTSNASSFAAAFRFSLALCNDGVSFLSLCWKGTVQLSHIWDTSLPGLMCSDGHAGGPLLAALVSGEAAEAIEKQPAGDAVAEALAVLRGIFEPQGIQVPTPLQVGSGTAVTTHCLLLPHPKAPSRSLCFSSLTCSLHDVSQSTTIPGVAALQPADPALPSQY